MKTLIILDPESEKLFRLCGFRNVVEVEEFKQMLKQGERVDDRMLLVVSDYLENIRSLVGDRAMLVIQRRIGKREILEDVRKAIGVKIRVGGSG